MERYWEKDLRKKEENGNMLVELAIVLPIFILMLWAIADFTSHAKCEYISILASRFATWGEGNGIKRAVVENALKASFPEQQVLISEADLKDAPTNAEVNRFFLGMTNSLQRKASVAYRSKIISDKVDVEAECTLVAGAK